MKTMPLALTLAFVTLAWTTAAGALDVDGDGYDANVDDCNDLDAEIFPGATEYCNGVDDDCDGDTDEGYDDDGDGVSSCGGDCDDGDDTIYQGASELCDFIDNDCDELIDEGFDADEDGFYTCDDDADCNDEDADVNPDADEVCNGRDDNCDGTADEGLDCETSGDDDDDSADPLESDSGVKGGGCDCQSDITSTAAGPTVMALLILIGVAALRFHLRRL